MAWLTDADAQAEKILIKAQDNLDDVDDLEVTLSLERQSTLLFFFQKPA